MNSRDDTAALAPTVGAPSHPPGPRTLAPGSLLEGKFRIVRVLGAGGMGAVYEITHELTKHRRALKLLHPELSLRRDVVERFLREASAAGRIGHPNIAETFDAGWLSTGEPYLVMDLLQGRTLEAHLEASGGLPLGELAHVGAQLCAAIAAAHAAGIVHRDLKPENVFLVEGALRPTVKVLDFGISKFTVEREASAITDAGAFLGTPLYMSPEQFESAERTDARSDVYALGLILYVAATGHHPYPVQSLPELARRILEDIPPASTQRTDLPKELDDLIARALVKSHADRTLTAAEMATCCARFAGGDAPVDALAETTLGARAPRGISALEASATALLAEPSGGSARASERPPVQARSLPAGPLVTSERSVAAERAADAASKRAMPLLWLGAGTAGVVAALAALTLIRPDETSNRAVVSGEATRSSAPARLDNVTPALTSAAPSAVASAQPTARASSTSAPSGPSSGLSSAKPPATRTTAAASSVTSTKPQAAGVDELD